MNGPTTLDQDAGLDVLGKLISQGANFATGPETCSIMRLNRRTFYDMIGAGKIPHTRAGRDYRIPLAWLREQARIPA